MYVFIQLRLEFFRVFQVVFARFVKKFFFRLELFLKFRLFGGHDIIQHISFRVKFFCHFGYALFFHFQRLEFVFELVFDFGRVLLHVIAHGPYLNVFYADIIQQFILCFLEFCFFSGDIVAEF